jgi:hypothetical protein
MDNKKYDEHGRPIKSKSFFDSFSKPKKQDYSYRVEKTKEENEIDKKLEDGLKDYGRNIDYIEEKDEIVEGSLEGEKSLSKEIDLTNFPIFLVYILVFILGFFGIFLGIVLFSQIKEKKLKGSKKILKHVVIAFVLYMLFLLTSFFKNFLFI